MAVSQLIGARIKRREDPELLTGTGNFVDDFAPPGLLHMYVVRSNDANARINSVDAVRAREADGVVAVFTGKDLAQEFKAPIAPMVWFAPEKKVGAHFPIAVDKAHYVGEPIAIVLATTRAAAEDAAERIDVRYDPLPAAVELEKAMDKGAPLVHEELGTNISCDIKFSGGDLEAAFREADVRLRHRFIQQRTLSMAIEPRAVVADYKRFGQAVTLWSSTQCPHLVRVALAEILGIPENSIRVIAPEVGGGFGSKIRTYPEDVLAVLASKKVGRPVKWVADRSEDLKATTHGRAQIWDVEAAAKKDGTVLGLKVTQYLDLGAYCGPFGTFQFVALLVGTGPYKVKAYEGRGVGVFTNTTPVEPCRGAGRPEVTYMLERVMDLLARETGIDPSEIRRRNLVRKPEFPYTTLLGLTYDSGDYELTLNKALEMVGYNQLRKQQADKRKQGTYMGIGLSTYVEVCGGGPAAATGPNAGIARYGSAIVRLQPTGKAEVIVGSSPHGQGHETTFAQVVADVLGLPLDDVEVMHGDTGIGPMGLDSYMSRSLSVDGMAACISAQKVRDKARKLAAYLLEAAEDDVVYEGGRAYVKGAPSRAKTIQELTVAAYRADKLPAGMEPTLEATTFWDPSNFVWPFGAHVCVVEVDGETGVPRIVRYVAVDDCGVRINPMIVDGQIHGGITHAVGQALFEEVVYRDDGQLETGNLLTYLIPTAADLPVYETAETITPSPTNPLGVKGIGEAGTIGATPAVINAIVDALQPFGVKDITMPATPQKVWQLMHRNGGTKR